jgi:pyruvate ferredoxin oxidoreductase gamma subunit
VDGSKIAKDTIGRALPNSPMVGALAKISGLVDLNTVTEDVAKSFGKKFPPKIVDGNRDAVKKGWEEVREI